MTCTILSLTTLRGTVVEAAPPAPGHARGAVRSAQRSLPESMLHGSMAEMYHVPKINER